MNRPHRPPAEQVSSRTGEQGGDVAPLLTCGLLVNCSPAQAVQSPTRGVPLLIPLVFCLWLPLAAQEGASPGSSARTPRSGLGTPNSARLFPVEKDGKWGFIDRAGTLVVAPKYDEVWLAYNPLFPINPSDFVERAFAEGLAVVRLGELWGYVDEEGREAIAPQFARASHFQDGLALARLGERTGFVDKTGKFTPCAAGRAAYVFSEGLALVARDVAQASSLPDGRQDAGATIEKFGFQDMSGKVIIEPVFQDARSFHEGLAPARRGDKWGFIDHAGVFPPGLEPRFEEADYFFEGLACVAQDGKAGYIGKDGRWVVKPEYDQAKRFCEGRGAVAKGKRCGFVDTSGHLVIPLNFDNAAPFSEGLAAVAQRQRYGFIDRQGNFAVEPEYEAVGEFSEGLAAATKDGACGYIDRTGRLVIAAKFDEGKPFAGGLARVRVDEKWGYIDRSGKYVWAPSD